MRKSILAVLLTLFCSASGTPVQDQKDTSAKQIASAILAADSLSDMKEAVKPLLTRYLRAFVDPSKLAEEAFMQKARNGDDRQAMEQAGRMNNQDTDAVLQFRWLAQHLPELLVKLDAANRSRIVDEMAHIAEQAASATEASKRDPTEAADDLHRAFELREKYATSCRLEYEAASNGQPVTTSAKIKFVDQNGVDISHDYIWFCEPGSKDDYSHAYTPVIGETSPTKDVDIPLGYRHFIARSGPGDSAPIVYQTFEDPLIKSGQKQVVLTKS